MSDLYRKVIITGGGGMLAQALAKTLPRRGAATTFLPRDRCDITQPRQIISCFDELKPTLVINCAAYTNVDKCEQETDACNAVNGVGVGVLAQACRDRNAMLVHFSTDFVFDGSAKRPYRADDKPNPLCAYGKSKLLGEQLLQQIAPPRWLIIRTAWLYGPGGPSFPKTMLDLARAGKPLRVVNDQAGSPTFTHDLAAATLDLIDRDAQGIWHVTNAGQTTWFDFAKAVFEEFGLQPDLQPITSADWKKMRPQSAPRPAYSVLDIQPFEQLVGRSMRPWREALHEFRVVSQPV